MLHAERGADDVDVEHAAQVVGVDVGHQRGDLDAGVVDQDVEAAERRRPWPSTAASPVVFLGHVELHEAGLRAAGRQLARGHRDRAT